MTTTDKTLEIVRLTKEAIELFEAGIKAAQLAFAEGHAKIADALSKLDHFKAELAAGDAAADEALTNRFPK